MRTRNILTLSSSPPKPTGRNSPGIAFRRYGRRSLYGNMRRGITGKELDSETGLYYYGARYLDPKTGRWLSGDPALGEYLPSAPVNDEARKRNGNLPGMGGVYNYVNLHVYHYAGNNPVKYVDPDGETTIVNNSKHWLIIRGENGQTHAVKPDETYDTEKNGFNEIDGILMPGGFSYKISNGNQKATLTVSENKKGGCRVKLDGPHMTKEIFLNAGKVFLNILTLFLLSDKLELSGRHKKGRSSGAGGSWWSTVKKDTGLTDEDINNTQKWNNKVSEYDKEKNNKTNNEANNEAANN